MRNGLKLACVWLMSAGLLTGCALGEAPPSNVSAGSLAKAGDLNGVQLSVGGKEFTEQQILCEIAAQALESAGAEVSRTCGMSGSSTVRSALLSGDIDMYWEYTGTAWITYLKETKPIPDPRAQYQAVAERDERKNSIVWLDRAPANNTYAVAASRETSKRLGVDTLSEYAELAGRAPAKASFCGAAEFFGRDDGWPGLQQAYGFTLPGNNVSELAFGAIFNSIDKAKPCAFGEVTATDGRIQGLGLVKLDDDKRFFPVYNPAISIRKDRLDANPAIAKVLAPVARALTDKTLQTLNARVDIDGATPEQTAKDWLVKEGFVGA